MFNLEHSISDWRSEMSRAGIKSPILLDELESHLREHINALVTAGESETGAFAAAIQHLGSPATLKNEFNKIRAAKYVPSLGWAAWIIFVTAFFLPAYTNGFGWQCAATSATCVTWPDFAFSWDKWGTILFFLLTPANVVMAISPFLVTKLSRRSVAFNSLRAANLTAFALVWTYFYFMMNDSGAKDLRIGYYLWTASFLIFSLSLFRFPVRKKIYARA
jgi:hypothetical protein